MSETKSPISIEETIQWLLKWGCHTDQCSMEKQQAWEEAISKRGPFAEPFCTCGWKQVLERINNHGR